MSGSQFSSDPWRRDDDRGEGNSAGDSGWSSSQPTGWERPTSDPSGPPPNASAPPGSSSSQSSASEWPGYPPTNPPPAQPSAQEPTRAFSADETSAVDQPGYQPYDPQSMPGYGSGPSGQSYASNPYEANPYDQPQANPYQPYPTPYGAYQAYAAPAQHPQATTAFILGLLGLVLCPPVGIGGLVMGGRVRREIDAAGGQWGGRGLATAGWVMGIIGVVLCAFWALLIVFGLIMTAVEG